MRRIAILTALLFASSSSLQSACHEPPRGTYIDFVGTLTGCAKGVGQCAATEQISFFARTPIGSSFEACDQFDWDFADGTPHSSSRNPTHIFVGPGSYAVTLTVTNDSGGRVVAGATVPVILTVFPTIIFFRATPPQVQTGGRVVLEWSTGNTPRGIRIDVEPALFQPLPFPVIGQPSVGRYEFTPEKSMTCTLTAYGDASYRTSSITVDLVPRQQKRRAVRH